MKKILSSNKLLPLLAWMLLASPLVPAEDNGISVKGGITVEALAASDSRVDGELVGSADLVIGIPAWGGDWTLYLEGNTTPDADKVSSMLGEANGDAGSALDDEGNGRIQVSELHYSHPLGGGVLVAGLMDVSAFLDGSNVANDETTQFLGAGLVNNATIEFPDYTLGLAWDYAPEQGLGYALVLTSSNGLGDNDNVSYDELFEINDEEKGIFAAGEVRWTRGDYTVRGGVWANTADHDKLNDNSGTENNYGIYTSVDGAIGPGLWNVRIGFADDEVSKAEDFIAAAVEFPFSWGTLGAGIAHTGVSGTGRAAGEDDTLQVEINARFEVTEQLQITPTIQWLENSGFDGSDTVFDDSLAVYGMRVNWTL